MPRGRLAEPPGAVGQARRAGRRRPSRAAAAAGTGARPGRPAARPRRRRAASAARGSRRRASATRAAAEARGRGGVLVARECASVRVAGRSPARGSAAATAPPRSGVCVARRTGRRAGRPAPGVTPEREDVAVALGRKRVQLGDERDVGLDPGLVQPLLAERPDAVVRQPGQVGVQDEAEGARHRGAAPRSRRGRRRRSRRRRWHGSRRRRQVAPGVTAGRGGPAGAVCPPSPRAPSAAEATGG